MTESAPINIRYDHREEPSGVVNELKRIPNVVLERAALEVGDYECAPGLVVERKSAADFSSSIVSRRLFEQVAKIKNSGCEAIFLIEGDPFSVGRLDKNAIAGAISYLCAIERMTVIPCENIAMTAYMVATISRHRQHGLGYQIQMRPPKPKTLAEQQSYFVEGLPTVGNTKAAKMLNAFASPAAMLNASESELAKVTGPATAATIHKLLHTRYRG